MTKMSVRIAYGSETIENVVKIGKVRPLQGVSRTRVKAHVHRQEPVCAGLSPHTQNLNNRVAYA